MTSDGLRQQLTSIARRAADVLRESRTRRAALNAVDPVAMLLLLAFPALQLLFLLFAVLLGQSGGKAPLWFLAIGTLVPPAVYILAQAFQVSKRSISDTSALGAVDHELELQDRLVTAQEFLEEKDRTPFMEAAIADAARFMDRAARASLPTGDGPWKLSPGVRALAGLAVVVIVSVIFFSPLQRIVAPGSSGVTGGPELGALSPQSVRDDENDSPAELAQKNPEVKPPPSPRPGALTPTQKAGDKSPLSEETKKTRGRTQVGQSSNASFASGASESKGVPTAQGQSSLENPKKSSKKKKKKPSKKKQREEEPDKQRKPEDASGATAGRGAASGSNKSPSASEWSSKDQVTSDDEDDLEDDEEVEDEFDDSDARGGVQPNLRDRKPPVNRDLSIGYGNQKNPDANGRGGASEQKKSRGVASLVLGVPIADHIKGRPNPGKTKVTQERVEPEAEESEGLVAQSRRRREDPVGHLHRPDLLPWMQDMLRTYYLSLRQEEPKEPNQ